MMQRRLEEQVRRHQAVSFRLFIYIKPIPALELFLLHNNYHGRVRRQVRWYHPMNIWLGILTYSFLLIVGKGSVRLSHRNGYIPSSESFESVRISRLLKASPTHHHVARNAIPRAGISVSTISCCGNYKSIFSLKYNFSVQVVLCLDQLSFAANVIWLLRCSHLQCSHFLSGWTMEILGKYRYLFIFSDKLTTCSYDMRKLSTSRNKEVVSHLKYFQVYAMVL